MDRFVNQHDINRYRRLANETTNAAERQRIMKPLAEEEAKFKSDMVVYDISKMLVEIVVPDRSMSDRRSK
ncbi:MAG: hypothetical protein ACXWKC_04180 [Xanthobacteraceae bacterium]